MSTIAIDNARNDERLSAFMSRIDKAEPSDNVFVDLPGLSQIMKKRKTIDGGRQSMITLDTAQNTTINTFTGYDVFDTSPQDTARTAVFAYINYGGTVTISWEEQRETANSDVRVFDLLRHKRRNALMSMKDRINSDLFLAVPAANGINTFPFLVTTTGTVGGIDSSLAANAYWRSQETTAVGAFAANGHNNMRVLWNDITRQGQGQPDLLLTTQAVFEAYEAELNVDVTYSNPDKLSRGAKSLEFKGKPVLFDADMTAGELYMINWDHFQLAVDTDGDFAFDNFITPANQKVSTAKLVFRGQIVTDNRRALGRLTGIT